MRPRRSRHRTKLYFRSDLLPVVKLWLLRLLVPLNGQSKFITRQGFENDDLAESLAVGVSADNFDDESYNVSALKSQLRERYLAAEAVAHRATLPEQVSENIGRLAELVGLNDADRRILEFAVMTTRSSSAPMSISVPSHKALRRPARRAYVSTDRPAREKPRGHDGLRPNSTARC